LIPPGRSRAPVFSTADAAANCVESVREDVYQATFGNSPNRNHQAGRHQDD
jgi:hypothetical protein